MGSKLAYSEGLGAILLSKIQIAKAKRLLCLDLDSNFCVRVKPAENYTPRLYGVHVFNN